MLAALAHLQQAMQRPVSSALDTKQHREDFRKHMVQDSGDVINKLVGTLGADIRTVIEEVVDQTHQFWTNQLHRMEEAHRASTAEMQQHLAHANEKLEETVKMYSQVIDNLNSQLADAHTKLELQEETEKTTVESLESQLSSSESTLAETTRTYKAVLQDMNKQLMSAQSALRDAELKGQQKRIVLGQTVEAQQKEVEELKHELKKAQGQFEASELRNKKLTAVSQHLLAKHQQLRVAAAATSSTEAAAGAAAPAAVQGDMAQGGGSPSHQEAGGLYGSDTPGHGGTGSTAGQASPSKELLQLLEQHEDTNEREHEDSNIDLAHLPGEKHADR